MFTVSALTCYFAMVLGRNCLYQLTNQLKIFVLLGRNATLMWFWVEIAYISYKNQLKTFLLLGRHAILLLFRVISHRIGIPCKTVSLANLIVITFRNKPKHVSQLICLPYLCVEKNMTHLQLKRTTIFGLWFSCLGVSFYFTFSPAFYSVFHVARICKFFMFYRLRHANSLFQCCSFSLVSNFLHDIC